VQTDKKLGRGFRILERDSHLDSPPQAVQAPAAETIPGQKIAPPAAVSEIAPAAKPDKPLDERREPGETVARIPLRYISPNPFQPRLTFDEAGMQELMGSIAASGMLQPILVRRSRAGYEIIVGHRRFEASRRLGLETIPGIVREMSDSGMLEMSLLENIQRKDLDTVEKARAFERLETEFGLTHAEIGRRLGMNRSTVSNYIRLLELPGEVLAHVSRGTLTMGHARALLAMEGTAARLAACSKILRDGMSVRDAEEHASDAQPDGRKESGRRKRQSKTALLKDIERTLQNLVGYKVTVSQTAKGSGKITIKFRSTDEFNSIYERITSAFAKKEDSKRSGSGPIIM
jgi:ParB family chromosome partitioning protein